MRKDLFINLIGEENEGTKPIPELPDQNRWSKWRSSLNSRFIELRSSM